jgi:phosphatidylglycerophosphate synthase
VTGSLVSPELRTRVRGLAEPIARGFGRLGLTPNHLTLIGFAIAIVAAVAAATQAWLAAGVLVMVGGVFDLLDGALARATGRANRLGAFMDSVFDRWGEGVVYVGIAWGCSAADFRDGAVLATAALAAAVMVSYARAKSEGLGFTAGTGMATVGLAPREVRIVILSLALFLVGLNGGIAEGLLYKLGYDLPFGLYLDLIQGREYLTIGLALITLFATITTIQRILHVRAQAREG